MKLPANWREAPLRSIAAVRFSSVDKKSYPGQHPVRLCNYTDVYNNDYITDHMPFMQATASESERLVFSLQHGDTIITKDSETPNDIGVPAVVTEPLKDVVCGYHLAHIRPNPADVDPIFLCKQISHHRVARYYGRLANGLTRYGLPTAAVEGTPIWLPPTLEDQQAIGVVLRAMDAGIQRTEALIAKHRRIRTGLMQDLLTKGIDANGRVRSEETHEFKDSPLGRIPDEWNVSTLGEVCRRGAGTVQTGPFGSQLHAEDYVEDGIPIITVEHLGDMEILHVGLPRVSSEDYMRLSSRYDLRVGDLVFSRVGAIDRCAMVTEEEDGWLFSGRCLRARLGTGSNAGFYCLLLNSYDVRRWILTRAVGSTMACLNTRILSSAPVAVPSEDEQNVIWDAFTRQQGLLLSAMDHLAKLCRVKSGLMQDLLTGSVPVPEAMVKELAGMASPTSTVDKSPQAVRRPM